MKKKHTTILITVIIVVVGLTALGVVLGVRAIIRSGITKGPDVMFGDQHLKTAVALIELHKVRYGRYPASLKALKFVGEWDQFALSSVRYCANEDGTAYFVEVERGWVGKPDFEMPPEFWQGTGYRPDLKPKK